MPGLAHGLGHEFYTEISSLHVFSIRNLLLDHGYLFLFTYIFLVQAGLPVPADPLLLIMGALSGDHLYKFLPSLAIAVLASVGGDYIWYELGRIRGRSLLGLVCKFSLEPDNCVRKTEGSFSKRGASALLFAKFVPGMGLVAMPLAGMIGMSRKRFLLYDAGGAFLWSGAYLGAGYLFHKEVNILISLLGLLGRRAGLVVAILIGAYLAFKYVQRLRFLRQLRVSRVSPQLVKEMIDQREPLTIVDLRHPAEVDRDGVKIPGALVIRPDDLRSRSGEIPPQHEIILYCT
jgi:membrane protein DedA with SNARE-associated domain